MTFLGLDLCDYIHRFRTQNGFYGEEYKNYSRSCRNNIALLMRRAKLSHKTYPILPTIEAITGDSKALQKFDQKAIDAKDFFIATRSSMVGELGLLSIILRFERSIANYNDLCSFADSDAAEEKCSLIQIRRNKILDLKASVKFVRSLCDILNLSYLFLVSLESYSIVGSIDYRKQVNVMMSKCRETESDTVGSLKWIGTVYAANFISNEETRKTVIENINGSMLLLRLQAMMYMALAEGMLAQENDDFVVASVKYSIVLECIKRMNRANYNSCEYLVEEVNRRYEYTMYMSETFANEDDTLLKAIQQEISSKTKSAIAQLKEITARDVSEIENLDLEANIKAVIELSSPMSFASKETVDENKEGNENQCAMLLPINIDEITQVKTFVGTQAILPDGAVKKTLVKMLSRTINYNNKPTKVINLLAVDPRDISKEVYNLFVKTVGAKLNKDEKEKMEETEEFELMFFLPGLFNGKPNNSLDVTEYKSALIRETLSKLSVLVGVYHSFINISTAYLDKPNPKDPSRLTNFRDAMKVALEISMEVYADIRVAVFVARTLGLITSYDIDVPAKYRDIYNTYDYKAFDQVITTVSTHLTKDSSFVLVSEAWHKLCVAGALLNDSIVLNFSPAEFRAKLLSDKSEQKDENTQSDNMPTKADKLAAARRSALNYFAASSRQFGKFDGVLNYEEFLAGVDFRKATLVYPIYCYVLSVLKNSDLEQIYDFVAAGLKYCKAVIRGESTPNGAFMFYPEIPEPQINSKSVDAVPELLGFADLIDITMINDEINAKYPEARETKEKIVEKTSIPEQKIEEKPTSSAIKVEQASPNADLDQKPEPPTVANEAKPADSDKKPTKKKGFFSSLFSFGKKD